jgi:hypothetical protein
MDVASPMNGSENKSYFDDRKSEPSYKAPERSNTQSSWGSEWKDRNYNEDSNRNQREYNRADNQKMQVDRNSEVRERSNTQSSWGSEWKDRNAYDGNQNKNDTPYKKPESVHSKNGRDNEKKRSSWGSDWQDRNAYDEADTQGSKSSYSRNEDRDYSKPKESSWGSDWKDRTDNDTQYSSHKNDSYDDRSSRTSQKSRTEDMYNAYDDSSRHGRPSYKKERGNKHTKPIHPSPKGKGKSTKHEYEYNEKSHRYERSQDRSPYKDNGTGYKSPQYRQDESSYNANDNGGYKSPQYRPQTATSPSSNAPQSPADINLEPEFLPYIKELAQYENSVSGNKFCLLRFLPLLRAVQAGEIKNLSDVSKELALKCYFQSVEWLLEAVNTFEVYLTF